MVHALQRVDVHALVELAGQALARKKWKSSGARSEAEARSYCVAYCRRRIGAAVARAYAGVRALPAAA